LKHASDLADDYKHSLPPICVVNPSGEVAGYLRTLRLEFPHWKVTNVHVPTASSSSSSAAAAAVGDEREEEEECNNSNDNNNNNNNNNSSSSSYDYLTQGVPFDPKENEFKWEDGVWKVRRLRELAPPLRPLDVGVVLSDRGELANLKLVKAQRTAAPEENEVEIRVMVVGLNFRDVLNVLGMYPGDPGHPGGDCAGVVVRIGEGVESFKVGDYVYGIGIGSLKGYTCSRKELFRKLPSWMALKRGASLPILMTTVHEAFVKLSKLGKGQRVLVHAGTGGVGLMAIYYAKRLGCEVVASAGAEWKQEYLKGIGVEKVVSSRDAEAFRRAMMMMEEGEGEGEGEGEEEEEGEEERIIITEKRERKKKREKKKE
jgi:hypothetical protein